MREVFKRFREYGLRFNAEKCKLRQADVASLGHRISAHRIQTKTEYLEAILDAQALRNLTEFRSDLDMVTYKFLPSPSTAMAPLYQLLHQQDKSEWAPFNIGH